MSRRLAIAAVVTALLALTGCTAPAPEPIVIPDSAPPPDSAAPAFPLVDAGPTGVRVEDGDDWSLPEWVRPASNSGFFSEEASQHGARRF